MEHAGKTFNLKDYVTIVLRRKWSLLVIVLAVVAPLIFYVRTMPDTYFAQSQLVIEDLRNTNPMTPQMLRPSRSFDFYQGIFNSRSFIQAVLQKVGRDTLAKAAGDTVEDKLAAYIASSISLSRGGFESFIVLSARASHAGMAFNLAQSATEIFKLKCREVVAEEAENTVKETEKQLAIIRDKLEEAEHAYRQYLDKTGNSFDGATTELKLLQDKYYEIRSEWASKEAIYEANRQSLAMLERKVAPANTDPKNAEQYNKAKEELRKKEKEKKRLESLGLVLGPSSPINQDIDQLEKEVMRYGAKEERLDAKVVGQWQKMRTVVAENEMELDLVNNKMKVYQRKIEQYKKSHPDELDQSLEVSRLERSRKVYEDTYNILLEQVEVAKIKKASETGGVTVVDAVYYPTSAVPRKEAIYYVVGIMVALMLGFGYIFLREFLDTTVKSNDDLEAYNIPIIGTIPHIDIAKSEEIEIRRRSSSSSSKEAVTTYPKELINFYKDESIVAESYRSLRTNLFFTSPDNPLHTLIVTSSGPHEGKSLTASNLCLACAQMGKRTLLIDSDLRRPVVHHLFQQPRENGFTDLFIGNSLKSVVRETGLDNLHVITAGRFTPNPSELLASKKIEKLIGELKLEYDLIVFDTPPVMAVTDAPLLSTKVDGTLLVVKSYSTDRVILERAINTIQNVNANILGFVLNDIDLSHRYASYGYYKYYYHYYRSKKD
ncbi:MAG: hypothetical protein A2268_07770 [Candidatus Raymondbacteria bacterium RifOxyA12_full_50_37]|uniref:non-specific protein-tyrosine kinase n=1 Tax=Candidatus Raymondbacteria bacterium RIFOXYD12_FULL_49_13 TaxID=1817890 RepID=A0A1F7F7U0_UNCRA|nr:MAG: hypothetical protein A2268_07770 [Candidatus Raymondbacteria bacterium RifOxyA12_full_50_37]OGJ88951.1 MAG: hypothetical protein A2350_12420 [Candidatus Raymondbacteria bacterium RifOxyB12_full_50_8]OGJ89603.1 MAG: hypothetical protein A2248_09490 [Candidatus Raymondbacteria bacterium RIFOXYA2_FULL_49_16]OGK02622.1 MAG: hypothetical protein A2519_11205 [Candidatus Raymondbacteria bacterium RIFOXYD12_FULL_49_13]OGP42859.1 MAG: hypothetical protein A2324_01905 [Candidatus Raymondbacteria 